MNINQNSNSNNLNALSNETSNRCSRHSDENLIESDDRPVQDEIPAASAIAGMISASNDLPYMTPPITNQHFSGDSQDSSSKANYIYCTNSLFYPGLYEKNITPLMSYLSFFRRLH